MNEMRHQILAVSAPRTAFWDLEPPSCVMWRKQGKQKGCISACWGFAKMLAFFRSILDWIKSLFWKEEMELTLVGLQYSGKTTFVNVIAVSLMYVWDGWALFMVNYSSDTIRFLYLYLVSFNIAVFENDPYLSFSPYMYII